MKGEKFMAKKKETRNNIVETAKLILEQNGPRATTIDSIIEKSGAPRGSVYYYFSNGRDQIVEEAVGIAGTEMIEMMNAAFKDTATVVQAIDNFFRAWGETLLQKDLKGGCAVVAVAIEGNSNNQNLQAATAYAFKKWKDNLSNLLTSNGISVDEANDLANLILASGEGAVILSRSTHSIEPFESVSKQIQKFINK
jgi:AcrR family transcriptional regulator